MTASVSPTARPSFLASAWSITRRGWTTTVRLPAVLVQSVFFPTFFLVVYTGLYAAVTDLPGFPTDDLSNWYVPFMVIQGAAFAGVGPGFATAVDMESGFFDRLLLMPGRRSAILVGSVGVAVVRATFVGVVVAAVGVALGASPTDWRGVPFLVLAALGVATMGALYSLALIYRLKDQRAAPLFPIGIFVVLFVSNAQVPLSITTGWLNAVGRVNPVSNILRLARQGFLDTGVTWSDTWGGLLAIAVCTTLLAWWAGRGLASVTP